MSDSSVLRTLLEMRDLLAQADEPQWVEQLDRLVASFQTAQAKQIPQVARQALAMFGGMGSLSDLVLYVQGAPAPDMNDRLEALRRQLYAGLIALIMNQESDSRFDTLSGLLDTALAMVYARLARAPDWQVLQMIQVQLQVMQDDVKHRRTPNAETQKRINIDLLAVREFEANDPEFADVLIRAAYLYGEL